MCQYFIRAIILLWYVENLDTGDKYYAFDIFYGINRLKKLIRFDLFVMDYDNIRGIRSGYACSTCDLKLKPYNYTLII